MAWIRSALKRLRDERATALGFAILVLVTSLVAASAPRLLDRLADATLRDELSLRPPAARSLELVEVEAINGTAADPLGGVQSEADALDETLPPEVKALVSERALLVEGVRWAVSHDHPTRDPSYIRLRIQPGAENRIHLVTGRMPTGASHREPGDPGILTLETAISTKAAAALGVRAGERLPLETDESDPLGLRGAGARLWLDVTGTFEVNDPQDPWWVGDVGLAQPVIRSLGGDDLRLDFTGLLAPEAYPPLTVVASESQSGVRYIFRDYVDAGRLRQRDLVSLIPAFRRLEALYPAANAQRNGVALRSGFRPFFEAQQRRWASVAAVLAVAVVGPAAVAVAALGMVAVLAARRRRAALSLSRGRGASLEQVTLATVAEGLLVAAPAAALGAVLAYAALPPDPIRLPALTAAVVAVGAIVVLVMSTVPATGGPGFGSGRELAAPGRTTPRRLVFEALLVLLAIGGATLLRDRGLRAIAATPGASTTGGGDIVGVDPLVAAVPALVGLAAGIVAIRLIGLPTRFFGRLARRGRGLIAVLAMRRASGRGGAPILLVLLATTTIGAFSSSALLYLDRAADAAAWREVGADVRVAATQGYLNRDFDFAGLPGVEAAARMFQGKATVSAHGVSPDLLVLNVEDFDKVVAGTPAAPDIPIDLFGPATQPLPIIVSTELANRPGGIKLDEQVTMTIEGNRFDARAVAVRDTFPGVGDASTFVIVSEAQLRALFPNASLRSTVAFLRAPLSAEPAIREGVSVMSAAEVTSRATLAASLRDAPVVRALRLGIAATAIVAAIYAALAMASALALAGASRAIESAHLRTLGVTRSQALGILVLEHGPALLLAFLGGIGLGVLLLAILLPGLGLDSLVGVQVPVSPGIDLPVAIAMALGLIAVALIGLLLGLFLERRTAPVAALRRGFE